MSSYNQNLYQVVFSTKYRQKIMTKEGRMDLFKCIWGILKNKNCYCYAVNGVSDHIHIVFRLHQSIALANLVKDIKLGTSSMIKEKGIFPEFIGWQVGYSSFTYSFETRDNLVRYVQNQEVHHGEISSLDELKRMLLEQGVEYDEDYLE
jgi:REP element-mobilizing transposase RayT